MTQKTALAVRHVAFEDLGSMVGPLERAGYSIDYWDTSDSDLTAIDPLVADLMVVLGGPIGVYDDALYPIVATEIEILKRRLAADMPTIGICLGAQLMAHALGSRVYPGPQKEIGWSSLTLTSEGRAGPIGHLEDQAVLHWHGDTFDLPAGCDLLASTDLCRNQAFSRGPRILGLQFHAEVRASKFEHWLMGHACELSTATLDPRTLRADARREARKLEEAAERLFEDWLSGLFP